ncbi:hypothetical protein M422DRAFT_256583 [Sphaerobolus stellatus SS14]|uniref:Uncharacterized protein n=1 Tax=Sphaerobolus stellatus (strain SS14) TaxID=990650 RepID=A0A0C9VRJ5_SPHS4|nr:hypothetical protein M422DRAFT_256583 [Sphaerobolus stellatus SS14]
MDNWEASKLAALYAAHSTRPDGKWNRILAIYSSTTWRLPFWPNLPLQDHCGSRIQLLREVTGVYHPLLNTHQQSNEENADAFIEENGYVHKFSHHLGIFDQKLISFTTEARQLGRSSGILLATRKLRQQLARLDFVLRENTAHLVPKFRDFHIPMYGSHSNVPVWTKHAAKRALDIQKIPGEILALANALHDFRVRLDEFQEYDDAGIDIKSSLKSFENDLKYWHGSLDPDQWSFRSWSVQRYVYQISLEVGNRIAELSVDLKLFIELGIPTIRHGQKRSTENLLNISTGATFFSAVTATMIQISYTSEGRLITIVNTFWYISLVLSIGAALNSLISMTWRQSVHGSRGHSLPLFVVVWLTGSPPAFLGVSFVCFSIGLVLFVWTSEPHPITYASTLVAAIVTIFGILILVAWMARERILASPDTQDTSLRNAELNNLAYFQSHKITFDGSESDQELDPEAFFETEHPDQIMDDNASETYYETESIYEKPKRTVLGLLSRAQDRLNMVFNREDAGTTTTTTIDDIVYEAPVDMEGQHESNPVARARWKRVLPVVATVLRLQRSSIASSEKDIDLPTRANSTDELPWYPELITSLEGSALQSGVPIQIGGGQINEKYGNIQCFKFSPNGRYLAVTWLVS